MMHPFHVKSILKHRISRPGNSTIFESQDQEIGKFYVLQSATKICYKSRSGGRHDRARFFGKQNTHEQ